MFPFLDEMLGHAPARVGVVRISMKPKMDGSDMPASGEDCGCDHMDLLKEILCKKYSLMLMYISYGDQLREFFRDGIYEHLQEHLEEERRSIYNLNKKITALGGDAKVEHCDIPCVRLDDVREVLMTILRVEEEAICLWSKLFHATDDDVPLNGMAQEGAQQDQAHADDLKRYLRSRR
jgi:bacterioferritin (cytochrome b1)